MCIVLNSLEHECSFKQERVVVIVDSVTMDITLFVVVCQAFSYIQWNFQIGVDAAFATCPIRQQKGAIGKQFDDCGGGEKRGYAGDLNKSASYFLRLLVFSRADGVRRLLIKICSNAHMCWIRIDGTFPWDHRILTWMLFSFEGVVASEAKINGSRSVRN